MFPKIIKLSILFILLLAGYNTASASFTISRPSTLNSGLVGYWTFDGADTNFTTNTVADKSGNGNNGTMINMSTSTARAPGKIGQALRFRDSNEYVSVTDPASGVLDPSYITVSAWIKLNQSSNHDYIVSKDRDGSDVPGLGGYELRINTGRTIRGQIWRNSTQTVLNIDASTVLKANTWYHTVMTFDGFNVKVYLNGIQDGVSNTVSDETIQPTTKNLTIGILSFNAPSWFPMNGLIDEVRVYNRALSASEVKKLYNQGASKFNVSPVKTLTTGLVGYWTFDGADTNFTTNTVADKSGNGNTGTMTNMSTSTARVPGKIGQALKFDGVNDYVDVPPVFTTNQTELTTSAWVYFKSFNQPSGTNRGSRIVSGWYNWNLHSGYLFGIFHNNGNNTSWHSMVNNGTDYAITYDTLSDAAFSAKYLNKWIHAVLVFKGGQYMKLYLDGELKNTTTNVPSEMVPDTSNNTWIGRSNINPGYTNSLIDEVRVYNRALSASEVKKLYNMGR